MKLGILTYHYSTNYGGVLQAYSLYNFLNKNGYDVEIINFVPSNYQPKVLNNIGIKSIIRSKITFSVVKDLLYRVFIKVIYSKKTRKKFDIFREKHMKLSKKVNEAGLEDILKNYDCVIVGSDQIWGPSQRSKPEYFLGYDLGNLKKISYAADSTVSEVEDVNFQKLNRELSSFSAISVRNKHSADFIYNILNLEPAVVADPTLLHDFEDMHGNIKASYIKQDYILVYTLGGEITGSNRAAINKIKKEYGDIMVYSIVIADMKFENYSYLDKIFYDATPEQWVTLFRNAKFIFTDSYHGTLFALKFKKPFLAYFVEEIRRTRFDDIALRYNIDSFIVSSVDEIDAKESLKKLPEYNKILSIIEEQKKRSYQFLKDNLNNY